MPTVKFQIRRDTSGKWASANPILGSGEPALEIDTRRIKYGDGITAWNNLPYFGVGPTIATGTYKPVLTNVQNIDVATAYDCQWQRVGNMVTVSGRVDVDPTATGQVILGLTLPVATANFTADQQVSGTVAAAGVAGQSGAAVALVGAQTARLQYVASDAGSRAMRFIFMYQIQN